MLQTVDWLTLLHPVLAVVLVYPLLGMVLRLAAPPLPGKMTPLHPVHVNHQGA